LNAGSFSRIFESEASKASEDCWFVVARQGLLVISVRGIFISYRREDTEGQAGRLYHDLVRAFGANRIFIDVAGIELGIDFRKAIEDKISSCGILLSLMGPRWLDAKNEAGHRRLEYPMDFVRLETATALKRGIPVIPVLVQNASMPRPDQLPEELRDLTFRNASVLTHARWDSDTAVLIKGLKRLIDEKKPRRRFIKVIAIVLVVIVVAFIVLHRH
jgi:TIR domain